MPKHDTLIIVCGVCGSGKSTLVEGLKKLGYHAHAVAQEHSYTPTMYQMTNPDFVIVLDCELEAIQKRRSVQWGEDRLKVQRERLKHAKENCNLYIDTSKLTPEMVLERATSALREYNKIQL